MEKEIIGFAKYLLILAAIGSAIARQWIVFAILSVLVVAVFYVQEYRKMYGNNDASDKDK